MRAPLSALNSNEFLSPEPLRPELNSHLLGVHDGGLAGPLFVFVGGMHGNEPAGVLALQDLLRELQREHVALRGRLVCFAGHLAALASGERYLDADFNRLWSAADMRADAHPGLREIPARDELLGLIEAELAAAKGPVIFLDLHSTSARGTPFSLIGDTRQNRRMALALPVPLILGLEENVEGALLGYFGARGHVAVGFEGGQHRDSQTRANLLAAAWLSLIGAGGLRGAQTPQGRLSFERLRAAGRGHPGVVEVRYRHAVKCRDDFEMVRGFRNFDAVRRGQVLAHEGGQPVCSHSAGLILMPLYQGQGHDGFFIGREVRRFWLRVSRVLRVLRLGKLAHWLPGIRRVERAPETLEFHPWLSREWVIEFFHLLGFRCHEEVDGRQRLSRRIG